MMKLVRLCRRLELTRGELICFIKFFEAPPCRDLVSGPTSPLEGEAWVRGERGKVGREVGRWWRRGDGWENLNASITGLSFS